MRRSFRSFVFGDELDPLDFIVMFLLGAMISITLGGLALFFVTYPQFALPALAIVTAGYLFARFIGPRMY